MNNGILTWENLRSCDFNGPNLCILCMRGPKIVDHVFFNCDFSRFLWQEVVYALNLWGCGLNVHLEACYVGGLVTWGTIDFYYFYITWGIWKVHNRRDF